MVPANPPKLSILTKTYRAERRLSLAYILRTSDATEAESRQKETRYAPSKFGLSGKNSARIGRTHPLFLIIGFTNEAIL